MIESLPQRERVPSYYTAHEQSRAIIETLADASLKAKASLADVMDQFFVDTATWGLDFWEWQVGIETDRETPIDVRRKEVRKKLLASGNTTAEMVRDMAEAMTGYRARVHVHDDYSFTLEFLGESAGLVDIDVAELRTIVEMVKPAHLRFIIAAITWSDIENIELTWRYFEDNPTTWAEFEARFPVHANQ